MYELIRALVDDGRDPDPVTALARGKHQPAADALQPDQSPTPERHKRLALHLADLYTLTVTSAAAASYARDVLDEAYRREFREQGIRMQQLGETATDRGDLTEKFTLIRDELVELWRRCEAAAKPGWHTP
jgi:replicative DNA helicase